MTNVVLNKIVICVDIESTPINFVTSFKKKGASFKKSERLWDDYHSQRPLEDGSVTLKANSG
jgi:hypothetical protein